MKRFFKIFFSIIFLLAIGFCALLGYLTITEYKPAKVEIIEQNITAPISAKNFNLMIWNIGYAGLDKDQDFFMDGGSMVNPTDKNKVLENMNVFIETIKKYSPDFLMLQEVDLSSKRSFFINQKNMFDENLNLKSQFAFNFNTNYVPYPIPPIGKVKSGLYSASKYIPTISQRISLPVPFKYPVRLANLKRCLLMNEFQLTNGKKLTLINLHLEAYDDGSGKKAQTEALLSIFNEEFEKGNYVIAGGDWNQYLNNFNSDGIPSNIWTSKQLDLGEDGKKFNLVSDSTAPTYRVNNKPYIKGSESTIIGVIDGFLVTPNIKVNQIKTIDLDFENSDHNPILLKVSLE